MPSLCVYIYTHTHNEGNQERSRMSQLIACALCAGEIKKVSFQVDASVNASAANFPIPNIYSRSHFTLAISIIAICSCPCADNHRGYKRPKYAAYVWAGNNACKLYDNCYADDVTSFTWRAESFLYLPPVGSFYYIARRFFKGNKDNVPFPCKVRSKSLRKNRKYRVYTMAFSHLNRR